MDEQRVGPLAASALLAIDPERVPEEVQDTLRERVQLGELRARILVAELLEIVGAFEARGIDVVAHKGPALSLLAYGRVGARDPADLDLVVHESDFTAAEQVLRERGYRRHSPGDLRPRLEAAWRRAWNETEFVSADGWVFVDLHWRVCPERFPFRVDSPRLWSRLTRAHYRFTIDRSGVQARPRPRMHRSAPTTPASPGINREEFGHFAFTSWRRPAWDTAPGAAPAGRMPVAASAEGVR